VTHSLADDDTEVTVLVPDRIYPGAWGRFLHDQTGPDLAKEIMRLPHANVTTVPFHVGSADPRSNGDEEADDGDDDEGDGSG
jgi:hypothetical protein